MPAQGTSFQQKGTGGRGGQGNQGGRSGRGRGNQDSPGYDKEEWKDRTCYKCGQLGHPAKFCTNVPANGSANANVSNDDDASRASRSSKASRLEALSNINKRLQKTQRQFAAITDKIEELDVESDVSDSDSEPSRRT